MPDPFNPNTFFRRAAEREPFAVYDGRQIERARLWSDVHAVASRLPDRPYLFNLCENRYLFCVCLLAAAARRQICLLPPVGQIAVIEELLRDYPDAYLAGEKRQSAKAEYVEIGVDSYLRPHTPPVFDWDAPAVIAFTSGSSGRPKACVHNLKTFAISAQMATRALGMRHTRRLMVSTTPPQHMYGLETSVFWPLFSDLLLCDARPFFPEDVRQTIRNAPFPALLATTPTHLRSLVKIDGSWHNLIGVISATDTLPENLARETAAILGQSPREIYGSTETLSFASRETLADQLWRPYPDARLRPSRQEKAQLESPHLPAPAILADRIALQADGRFQVLGRDGDMVKIGGKRASLSELNRRLTDIAGIDEGFFFLQTDGANAGRLAAIVVSGLDRQSIRAGLKPYLDEVFLPKKIHFVQEIPRDATGKLSKATREKLVADLNQPV